MGTRPPRRGPAAAASAMISVGAAAPFGLSSSVQSAASGPSPSRTTSIVPFASSGIRNIPPTAGLRRSKSARITRSPRRASATARFAAVVVFPSPATALVTAITVGSPRPRICIRFAARRAYVSPKRDSCRPTVTMPPARGRVAIDASTGRCSAASTSFSERTRVLSASRAPAIRSEMTRPIAAPEQRVADGSR